jgi:hypothetical protein
MDEEEARRVITDRLRVVAAQFVHRPIPGIGESTPFGTVVAVTDDVLYVDPESAVDAAERILRDAD